VNQKRREGEASVKREGIRSGPVRFTSGTSEQFWEVETDLKWESLTRAAKEGEEVGVLEADVEGKLALGGVH